MHGGPKSYVLGQFATQQRLWHENIRVKNRGRCRKVHKYHYSSVVPANEINDANGLKW